MERVPSAGEQGRANRKAGPIQDHARASTSQEAMGRGPHPALLRRRASVQNFHRSHLDWTKPPPPANCVAPPPKSPYRDPMILALDDERSVRDARREIPRATRARENFNNIVLLLSSPQSSSSNNSYPPRYVASSSSRANDGTSPVASAGGEYRHGARGGARGSVGTS